MKKTKTFMVTLLRTERAGWIFILKGVKVMILLFAFPVLFSIL